MFQIVRISPAYCTVTDGLVGSRVTRLPMSYKSKRLAEKLAARMSDEEYQAFGDDYYTVTKYGHSRFASTVINDAAAEMFDEILF